MKIREKIDKVIELILEKKDKIKWNLEFKDLKYRSETWELVGEKDDILIIKIILFVDYSDMKLSDHSFYSISINNYCISLLKVSPLLVNEFVSVIDEIFCEEQKDNINIEISEYQKIIDVLDTI